MRSLAGFGFAIRSGLGPRKSDGAQAVGAKARHAPEWIFALCAKPSLPVD